MAGAIMTELLTKAFAEASRLSAEEQDALAVWILEEIETERQWDEAFARSADALARLADEALAEHRAGRTKELVPDEL
jgi:hypothetical protein